jgi:hypothetical protein
MMATPSSSRELAMRSLILGLDKLGFNRSPFLFLCFAGIVLENMVHLFKGSALGFGHEEECPHSGEHTEDSEEDIGPVAGVLNERWGNETLSNY